MPSKPKIHSQPDDVDASSTKRKHEIVYAPVESIKPYTRNARVHGEKQLKLLCEGYKKYGVTNPILVDEHFEVLAGHARHQAAVMMGLKTMPVIVLAHLTEKQKRAYRIADNRIAELATWDQQALALEFKDLIEIQADVDLSVTGFDAVDIDLAIQSLNEKQHAPPEDEILALPPKSKIITQLGDMWILSDHRLHCGDARDLGAFKRLMGRAKARMVITDPPFNVAISGHVSGLGKHNHREFVMASGEMSSEEFEQFLEVVLRNIAAVSAPGCLVFTFMDWRHLRELLAAGYAVFSELKNLIVWAKRNGGMGAMYRSQHEVITLWKHGKAPHINNVQMGTRRYRTNVWSYDGANTFKKGRDAELDMHPTVKPVAMIADALLDCSHRCDVVVDPFAGSGTILIAAERTGRKAYAMELDPAYCDVAIRRWQKYTGKKAVLAETGQTFDQVEESHHA